MIKFGPSGNSESFYAEGYTHTEEAAKYVKERGLDCFEYSFGRGVRMSEEKAVSIRRAFEAQGVEISLHAPYFINFANPSDEMAAKSYEYVLQSGNMARLMGAKRVVFHPAAQGKAERADAVALTKERLKILRDFSEQHSASHPDVDFYIFGHMHVVNDSLLSSGKRMVVLGEWINGNTFARFDGDNLELLHFD